MQYATHTVTHSYLFYKWQQSYSTGKSVTWIIIIVENIEAAGQNATIDMIFWCTTLITRLI